MCDEYCCLLLGPIVSEGEAALEKALMSFKWCTQTHQKKIYLNELNFIQPSTSNKIFRVFDFSISSGVAPWFPLSEIKLFSFICTCFGCAGRDHARKVTSALCFFPVQVMLPCLLWITSVCFTEMCHCFLLALHLSQKWHTWEVSAHCSQDSAVSWSSRSQLVPHESSSCSFEPPEINWEAVPQCKF